MAEAPRGRRTTSQEEGKALRIKSLVAAALGAVAVAAFGAGSAFAGEITGSGKQTGAPEHARSICAFSGQNDEFVEGDETAPRTQSYGQIVRMVGGGVLGGIPGFACNPARGFEE